MQTASSPQSLSQGEGLNTKTMKKLIPFLISLLLSISAVAQGEQGSSELMRSHLKIYVVVAVLLIIFAGISVFLFSLEGRLKKLEKERPKGH